jgi:hypothetical protein
VHVNGDTVALPWSFMQGAIDSPAIVVLCKARYVNWRQSSTRLRCAKLGDQLEASLSLPGYWIVSLPVGLNPWKNNGDPV